MTETVELKPCPFCGHAKAFSGSTLDDQFYVSCGDDNCSGMVGYFSTEAEAITAWNTRSDHAVRDRVTDEMVEAGAKALSKMYQGDNTDEPFGIMARAVLTAAISPPAKEPQ